MDGERWERVQNVFHRVADLDPAAQEKALAEACAGDESLAADVRAMLEQDREACLLLDRPVEHVAGDLIGEGVRGLPFERIGPYRLERLLGEGGMGAVFLGVRDDLGSAAAVKLLRDAWISPARRARFASEQRTLAQLNHPSIARLLDADTLEDGTPYFVMEYVDGVPLDRHCEERGASVGERLALFRSVCEAVRFAHARAVIHRDLKPSNIFVTSTGEVKLLDFGIAKNLRGGEAAINETRTGLRLMTPAYASPEQIRGEAATVQADVYSLGVVLYQLLASRLPFDVEGRTPVEAMALLAEGDPPRPSSMARRAGAAGDAHWDDLDVLCLTAMHKDVRKRYGSVEALLRDVDHYLRAEPLEARPDTFGYRLARFVRRRRAAVAAGAAVTVLFAGVVTVFLTRLAAERNAAVAEAARAHRIERFMLDLFRGGDKEAGPANDLRVSELVDRGAQEAGVLDRDPAVQAEMFRTLGEIYQKLGSLDRADALLNAALTRRRKLAGGNAAVADSLIALGLLRADQARLDDAERLVREGLALSRSLPANHPTRAAASDALGHVLEEKGAYAQAIPVLEEAVRMRSQDGSSTSDMAGSLYGLANVHFYAGHYAESRKLNLQALDMYRQAYGDRHPLAAETLINLGAIEQELGNYAEAERLHRQALEITRAFYGDRHYRTAAGMIMVARALSFERRYDEAAPLLRSALGVLEGVFGDAHPRVASALNELGNVAIMRGRYDEAKETFTRILAIYRRVHGARHYLIGTALSNLGSAYMGGKDNVRAERQFREALEMYNQTLGPEHLNTAIARIKLGRALLRQKRYAEAEAESGAGYRILKAQANPSVSYLNSARSDLAEAYDALGRRAEAEALRREAAQVNAGKR
jgi:serine/threonine-protein kinase